MERMEKSFVISAYLINRDRASSGCWSSKEYTIIMPVVVEDKRTVKVDWIAEVEQTVTQLTKIVCRRVIGSF